MVQRAFLFAAALACAAPAVAAAPDFTGSWERYPQPDEKVDPRYAPTGVPDPPMKPEHMAEWKVNQQRLAERLAEHQPAGDNYINCIPDGMPAMMMGMFPMEIFQRQEQVNITQEAFNQTRRVYMNEKLPSASELDPTFYGRSVGRWEADTLVIETTGIKQNVEFQWTPHSENMKITERLRLLAPDILQDRIVVEDDYFTKPWTYSYSYRRMPKYKLMEYVCENNRNYIDEAGKTRLRIDPPPAQPAQPTPR